MSQCPIENIENRRGAKMCFMSDWKHHPISTQGIIMNHLHELKLKVIFKLHKTGHLPTHVKMIRGNEDVWTGNQFKSRIFGRENMMINSHDFSIIKTGLDQWEN